MIAGLVVVFSFVACSSKKESGACVTTFDGKTEQCRPDTAQDLCKQLGEPTASLPQQASRFEPVSKEDRERWENVKSMGGHVSGLTCQRLGFMHCSQASGYCTAR